MIQPCTNTTNQIFEVYKIKCMHAKEEFSVAGPDFGISGTSSPSASFPEFKEREK